MDDSYEMSESEILSGADGEDSWFEPQSPKKAEFSEFQAYDNSFEQYEDTEAQSINQAEPSQQSRDDTPRQQESLKFESSNQDGRPSLENGSTETPVLFVGNLPPNTTNKELTKIFCGQADFVKARVVSDQVTGVSKHYGFVDFKCIEGARNALHKLKGLRIRKRKMSMKYARLAESELALKRSMANLPEEKMMRKVLKNMKSFGVTLLFTRTGMDRKYPLDTPLQKTVKFIEMQFSWLDFHFSHLLELRDKFDSVSTLKTKFDDTIAVLGERKILFGAVCGIFEGLEQMHQLGALFSLHPRLPTDVASHHETLRLIRNKLSHNIEQASHQYMDLRPVHNFIHHDIEELQRAYSTLKIECKRNGCLVEEGAMAAEDTLAAPFICLFDFSTQFDSDDDLGEHTMAKPDAAIRPNCFSLFVQTHLEDDELQEECPTAFEEEQELEGVEELGKADENKAMVKADSVIEDSIKGDELHVERSTFINEYETRAAERLAEPISTIWKHDKFEPNVGEKRARSEDDDGLDMYQYKKNKRGGEDIVDRYSSTDYEYKGLDY